MSQEQQPTNYGIECLHKILFSHDPWEWCSYNLRTVEMVLGVVLAVLRIINGTRTSGSTEHLMKSPPEEPDTHALSNMMLGIRTLKELYYLCLKHGVVMLLTRSCLSVIT